MRRKGRGRGYRGEKEEGLSKAGRLGIQFWVWQGGKGRNVQDGAKGRSRERGGRDRETEKAGAGL